LFGGNGENIGFWRISIGHDGRNIEEISKGSTGINKRQGTKVGAGILEFKVVLNNVFG